MTATSDGSGRKRESRIYCRPKVFRRTGGRTSSASVPPQWGRARWPGGPGRAPLGVQWQRGSRSLKVGKAGCMPHPASAARRRPPQCHGWCVLAAPALRASGWCHPRARSWKTKRGTLKQRNSRRCQHLSGSATASGRPPWPPAAHRHSGGSTLKITGSRGPANPRLGRHAHVAMELRRGLGL